MKETSQIYKNILIELIDKEIKELQNHNFTFHSEREISYNTSAKPTAFHWYTHGQFYYDNIIQKKIVVSENEARYNREVLTAEDVKEYKYVNERIEILKDMKKFLEGNRICLEEL